MLHTPIEGILTDLSAAAPANAIQMNFFELLGTQRLWPKVEIHEEPELLWAISDIPHTTFNFVLPRQFRPDVMEDSSPPEEGDLAGYRLVDAAIEASIARYEERKLPFTWRFGPATRPRDLGRRLERHGFVLRGDEPAMALDLRALKEDTPVSSELVIERVTDTATLRLWGRVTATGFGLPEFVVESLCDWFAHVGLEENSPVHHYLGWLNGEPVATSTLYFGAGVAVIYRVATLPQARGRGFGATITLKPLHEARAKGYRVATLYASPLGVNIYRRMGFQEYGRIVSYMRSSP